MSNSDQPSPFPVDATTDFSHQDRASVQQSVKSDSVPGYEILKVLGRGGMGVVYHARHVQLNREVALKMILAGSHASEDELARFRTEAEAVAQLKHVGIVQIHDIGEHEGRPFLSLEYCEQGSLEERLKGRPLSPADSAKVVEQLARAMEVAHREQIIHRDLKPANILFDSAGSAKVSDFGLAKKLDTGGQTRTGAIMGTPSYMAPEQAAGKTQHIGPCSDVYSLGVILYECLTGRPPFKGDDTMETLLRVIQEEPIPPSRLEPKIPRDLEIICVKSLEKDPARRYEHAGTLADDLQRFLANEPIHARPVGPMGRLWKWTRRRPALATLIGSVSLLLCVIFTVVMSYNFQLSEYSGKLESSLTKEKQTSEKLQKTVTQLEAANSIVRKERDNVQIQLATNDYENGLSHCREGNMALGTLLMVRGLQQAPEDANELRLSIRRNLAAWEQQLHQLKAIIPQVYNHTIALSPNGRRVMIAVRRSVVVKDLHTNAVVSGPYPHPHHIVKACFSPDGKLLLTGCMHGAIQLRDITSGKLVVPEIVTEKTNVLALQFSPDGKLFLTSVGSHLRLYDSTTGKLHLPPLKQSSAIRSARFLNDGKQIVTATYSGEVILWDTNTLKKVRVVCQLPSAIIALGLSPDEKLIATGESTGAKIWNMETGKLIKSFQSHRRPVNAIAFSPDGKLLVTGSEDQTARVWDVAMGKQIGQTLRMPSVVRAVTFSPDGRFVLVSELHEIRIWKLASFIHQSSPIKHQGTIADLAVNSEGTMLFTGSQSGVGQLWNLTTGQQVGHSMRHSGGRVKGVFSPDGQRLATGGFDRQVRIWDVKTGKQIGKPLQHPHNAWATQFSLDGKYLLTNYFQGQAQWWNIQMEKPVPWILPEKSGKAFFSPDRTLMVSIQPGGFDRIAKVWDIGTKKRWHTLYHSSPIIAMAFSPNHRYLVTGCYHQTMHLWDLQTGKQIRAPLKHQGQIAKILFSPDGTMLLSAGNDRTVRMWEFPSGRPIGKVVEHSGNFLTIALHPSGEYYFSGGEGGLRVQQLLPPLTLSSSDLKHRFQITTGESLNSSNSTSNSASMWRRERRIYEKTYPNDSLLTAPQIDQALAAYYRGQSAYSLKKWSFATQHFQQAVKLKPTNLDYQRQYLEAALRANRWEVIPELVKMLDKAGKGQNRDWWMLTSAYAAMEQFNDALDAHEKYIQPTPNDLERSFNHAALLALAGRTEEYQRLCQVVIQKKISAKDHRSAYLIARMCTFSPDITLDRKQHEPFVDQMLKHNDEWAFHLHTAGVAYLRYGDYQKAITTLEKSIKADPRWWGQPSNLTALALAWAYHGDKEKAKNWLNKAEHWLNKTMPTIKAIPGSPMPMHSHDQFAFRVLLKEAHNLLSMNDKP